MKVKCINRSVYKYLTIDKIYDIIKIVDNDNEYWMINDIGNECWYPKDLFKPISEIRNEKIDKLLK